LKLPSVFLLALRPFGSCPVFERLNRAPPGERNGRLEKNHGETRAPPTGCGAPRLGSGTALLHDRFRGPGMRGVFLDALASLLLFSSLFLSAVRFFSKKGKT
jgi:hypothetical protein